MRDYRVPFSTREETPFILGLTAREMLWIGGGFILGLVSSVLTFMIIGAQLRNLILSLPTIIPFTFAGFYLAKKKVSEDDHDETLDRHYIKRLRYKFRPHKYLNYRRAR